MNRLRALNINKKKNLKRYFIFIFLLLSLYRLNRLFTIIFLKKYDSTLEKLQSKLNKK